MTIPGKIPSWLRGYLKKAGNKLGLKTDLDAQGNSIDNQLLQNFTSATEKTISSGTITIDQTLHTVDTEADASSDDLDTINEGSAGDILYLRAQNDSRTVVLKHGTGNILTYSNNDLTFDNSDKSAQLIYNGANWRVLAVHSFRESYIWGYRSGSNLSINHDIDTKVQLNAEQYDVENEFDPSTNYRFTADRAGRYLVIVQCRWNSSVDQRTHKLKILKNGVLDSEIHAQSAGTRQFYQFFSYTPTLSADDYLEMYVYQDCGESKAIGFGPNNTFLIIKRLS